MDGNQKFLDKFKDQISMMGKDGILGTDNNISSISKKNNNINNNSKIRKGSAFLKPIKPKEKVKNVNTNINDKGGQVKNNKIEENNNKYTPINNPNTINQNQNINNFPMQYYKYQNPYMFVNYNQNNINNIQPGVYPPYQLYYFPNQNIIMNPYLINNNQNNIQMNIENNNNIEDKNLLNNKKKLRPISAQIIGRSNRSYINNNNVTNLTMNNKSNMTNINRFEYKPYTLKDYKEIMNVDTLGGLGANIGTEEWEKKKEKMDKMNDYAKNIFKKSKGMKNKINKKKKKNEQISTRKRASEYSKLIRPKSSNHFNIITIKQKNSKINEEIKKEKEGIDNNKINKNIIIQGKNALINAKKLREKNNNENDAKNENNEKIKDIFNDEIENDDKEMMNYYNKFRINDNEIFDIITHNNEDKNSYNNNDSLEIDSVEKKEKNIKENKVKKKYETFKEQRNAVNNRCKNNNNENKDNNIFQEYNEEKEKEIDLISLLLDRENI